VSCRIGISEKGQATVKLSVSSAPGHSSMPPRESSIGILASAVRRQVETPKTLHYWKYFKMDGSFFFLLDVLFSDLFIAIKLFSWQQY